jgi:hypothetical protein
MNASEQIDELIARLTDWRGTTVATIRRIVHEADPDTIETWKWMGSPVFEHDGIVCVVTILKDKVKLTFSEGASLPDANRLFNAGLEGNKWRAIDIYQSDKVNESSLKAMVQAGVAHNLARVKSAARKKSAK